MVLSINAGSSSLKFALAKVLPGREPVRTAHGVIEGIGTAPHMVVHDIKGHILNERHWDKVPQQDHDVFLAALFDWVDTQIGPDRLIGVGHRVVHGGQHSTRPVLVNAAILDRLDALIPLAPLHQPHNLAAIRTIWGVRPELPQVACFDTAFHAGQAPVATRFAIPRALEAEGVRRYGFHGLSYEYGARLLAQIDPDMASGRLIVAHLGNGASLCAIRNGQSIDTTMGFTALDGLMMGTRCGALDPGVILYLQQTKGLNAAQVQHLLYEQSGLLGVSGLSSDMRDLEARPDLPAAREAIALFVYRIVRETGALASVMGGLDGFVFTGGIGEHSAAVRADVCQGLSWLGIALDPEANARGAAVISTLQSAIKVRLIATDEEHMIAMHSYALIEQARAGSASE